MIVKSSTPAARPAGSIAGLNGSSSFTAKSWIASQATSAIVRIPTSTPHPCQPTATCRSADEAALTCCQSKNRKMKSSSPPQPIRWDERLIAFR